MDHNYSAMDKTLAYRAGGWDSNRDMTKDFSAPILLDTPPRALTLSHNACRHVLHLKYLSWGQ